MGAEEVAARLEAPPEHSCDVVLGFYERWRGRIYAAVAYFTPESKGWTVVHVHRKMFLPTYGVFDEARFVETGTELPRIRHPVRSHGDARLRGDVAFPSSDRPRSVGCRTPARGERVPGTRFFSP